MPPQMKLETQGKKVVKTPLAPVSMAETESIEEFEDEYDDDPESQYEGEPSFLDSIIQFTADNKEAELAQETVEDLNIEGTTEQTLSPVQVQAVVNEINKMAAETVDKGKMKIGEYVLSVVFKDDLQAVSSQDPYKKTSLTEIAKHPDLLVDRRQLGTWARVAAFRRKLMQDGVDCTKLTYSHFAAIFRLKKDEKRIELAEKASRDDLSVRQLMDEIESCRRKIPAKGKHQELLKKVEDPFKLMEDEVATELLSDPQKLAELTSGDRVDLIKAIDKAESRMDKSHSFLQQAKKAMLHIELGPYQQPEV
jgi:hypothetical protein